MTTYQVKNQHIDASDEKLDDILGSIYGSAHRPLCMCRRPGIEMYIAKINGSFIIKRMPNTGVLHAASCESYEPPAELSGRGEVLGAAIETDTSTGVTSLKLDFSLSKTGARAAPAKTGIEHDSVRTDGKKLTLRGVLHYLYDEAGLSRWSPAMEGKRSWFVVRRALLEAASDKQTKGSLLTDKLYIPESFSVERKAEINQRRMVTFRALGANEGSTRKLGLIIGEVKAFGDARYGKKIVFKHLGDCPIMMNEDIYSRFTKRFDTELSMWSQNEEYCRLLMIATYGVNSAGTPSIEEMSVMVTNLQWIPFETEDDRMLIEALIEQKRKFLRGQRYNLPSSKVLAVVTLNDTPEPVALYIAPYNADEKIESELQTLRESSQIQSWLWNTAEIMPAFPAAEEK